MPDISVVICTRDRGLRVLEAVRSVLADGTGDLECIVIDQSVDAIVDEALARQVADPRVRYIKTRTRGLSAARNIGMRLARSPLVAMTDDDCVVDRAWITEIVSAFAKDPAIAVVFGNVEPVVFDSHAGFIPSYQRERPFLATRPSQKAHVEGMGACMAFDRQAIIDLGGFDERLGAGSALCAGEDVDLTLRVLAAGRAIFETPAVKVIHQRIESWTDRPALVRSYWLGAGAALGKHLRRRPVAGTVLLARLGVRFVFGRSRIARSMGPYGMAASRLMAFMAGLRRGVMLGVESASPAPVSAAGRNAGS